MRGVVRAGDQGPWAKMEKWGTLLWGDSWEDQEEPGCCPRRWGWCTHRGPQVLKRWTPGSVCSLAGKSVQPEPWEESELQGRQIETEPAHRAPRSGKAGHEQPGGFLEFVAPAGWCLERELGPRRPAAPLCVPPRLSRHSKRKWGLITSDEEHFFPIYSPL